MIKVTHVRRIFGGTAVLDDVTFALEKSCVLGLAGASGSGKSTLLRCLQGLDFPDSGSIQCSGRVCFIFQDFQLFPHMTVWENIVYAPALGNKKTDYAKRAKKLLKDLGLEAKLDEYPVRLSGGQRQRVALARGLMIDPDILLCDEPTSGLDFASVLDVVALLNSVRDRGVTMVIASHDLDFLTQMCDRIVLLKNGTVAADISPRMIPSPIDYLKHQ
jgi:polar amino acid transport system ATP-binding protein